VPFDWSRSGEREAEVRRKTETEHSLDLPERTSRFVCSQDTSLHPL